MHIVADMVCAAVPHIAPDVFRLVQHARVAEQRCVVAANRCVHLRHREARLDNGEHVIRRLQRAVEQQLLLVREAPVARETAADVGHQAVMLRADIVEHHVAVVRLPAVGIIVDAEVVFPRADDGRERRPLRAVLGQRIVKFRLVLVFVHPRTARLHHCQNALARHLFRLADGVDFAGLLDEPQTAQDGVRVLDLQIGIIRLNLLQQPMRRAVNVLRRHAEQVKIHLRNLPAGQGVVSARRQRVEIRLELVDKANVGNAGQRLNLGGLQARTRPALRHQVGRQNVNLFMHIPGRLLHCHQHKLVLVKPGQVVEIAVGIKRIIFVIGLAHVFAGENDQQRRGLHGFIEPFAVSRVERCVHRNFLLD